MHPVQALALICSGVVCVAGKSAVRDCVQFVPFREFAGKHFSELAKVSHSPSPIDQARLCRHYALAHSYAGLALPLSLSGHACGGAGAAAGVLPSAQPGAQPAPAPPPRGRCHPCLTHLPTHEDSPHRMQYARPTPPGCEMCTWDTVNAVGHARPGSLWSLTHRPSFQMFLCVADSPIHGHMFSPCFASEQSMSSEYMRPSDHEGEIPSTL